MSVALLIGLFINHSLDGAFISETVIQRKAMKKIDSRAERGPRTANQSTEYFQFLKPLSHELKGSCGPPCAFPDAVPEAVSIGKWSHRIQSPPNHEQSATVTHNVSPYFHPL